MNNLFDSLSEEDKKRLGISMGQEELPSWIGEQLDTAPTMNTDMDKPSDELPEWVQTQLVASNLTSPQPKPPIPDLPIPGVPGVGSPMSLSTKKFPPGKFESKSNTNVDFKSDTQTKPFDIGIKADVEEIDPAIGEERKKKINEYIMEKYKLGPYSDENRQSLIGQNAEYNLGDRTAAALASLGAGIARRDAGAAGEAVLARQAGQRKLNIDQFDKGRDNRLQEFGLAQQLEKLGSEMEQKDSKSNVSVTLRNTYKKLFPDIANKLPNFESLSAYDIANNLADPIKLLQRDKETTMDYDIRRQELGQRGVEARALRQNTQNERDVQKLSDKVAPMQDMLNGIGQVEDMIGFKIDDFNHKDSTVKGKKVDLPGVSIPLLGRTTFYNTDASNLESAISGIFNKELKDRSGAAVTTPELDRLKAEFNSGKFNSERELISALKRYKDATIREMKNREAAFSNNVKGIYQDRGGVTSGQVEHRNPVQQQDSIKPKPSWAK